MRPALIAHALLLRQCHPLLRQRRKQDHQRYASGHRRSLHGLFLHNIFFDSLAAIRF
jgi:hypothetical protein